MNDVSGPCSVDCGLQLGAPRGIGTRTAPNLLGAHADLRRRLLEPHSLTQQLEQSDTLFRRELPFRLPTFALSLERCAGRPAIWTGAAGAHS